MWRFEVYEDFARGFRWRLVAPNNKIIADSGEGYVTRFNAHRAADTVRAHIANAATVDI